MRFSNISFGVPHFQLLFPNSQPAKNKTKQKEEKEKPLPFEISTITVKIAY